MCKHQFCSDTKTFLLFNSCFQRLENVPAAATIKEPCSSVLKGQKLKVELQDEGSLALCEVKAFTPDEGDCLSVYFKCLN